MGDHSECYQCDIRECAYQKDADQYRFVLLRQTDSEKKWHWYAQDDEIGGDIEDSIGDEMIGRSTALLWRLSV